MLKYLRAADGRSDDPEKCFRQDGRKISLPASRAFLHPSTGDILLHYPLQACDATSSAGQLMPMPQAPPVPHWFLYVNAVLHRTSFGSLQIHSVSNPSQATHCWPVALRAAHAINTSWCWQLPIASFEAIKQVVEHHCDFRVKQYTTIGEILQATCHSRVSSHAGPLAQAAHLPDLHGMQALLPAYGTTQRLPPLRRPPRVLFEVLARGMHQTFQAITPPSVRMAGTAP